MMQKRKQNEASKGFVMNGLLSCRDILLWFLNFLTPLTEFRLGFKQEAIIAK